MKNFFALATLAQLCFAAAVPHAHRRADSDRGNQTVAGLGDRKQAVLDNGGNTMDIAIAMLETDTMTTDYTYGDGKTGDATNFGIFKQNWMMLRTSTSKFMDQTVDQVDNGAVLNDDLGLDITCRHESQDHYGKETWFSGHRNGASGLQNPGTEDIKSYMSAIEWIQGRIDSDDKYLSDDTRFWVDVQAI